MIKEINKFKEPSKLALRFANTVFLLGIVWSTLIAIYLIYRMLYPEYYVYLEDQGIQKFYFVLVILSCFSAILFFLCLKLKNILKLNLSILFVTIAISFYIFELFLEFSTILNKKESELLSIESKMEIAKKMNIKFDKRNKIEVLENLAELGNKAFPNINPELFIYSNGLKTNDGMLYPFGGISNIVTIFDNESGYYPIIETDEHGFNNPKGLYEKNEVDIVLIGDSQTEGYSVNYDETISAFLKKAGFKTLNFGKGGNGTLIEFATLKEYAEPLQPKIVLWIYVHNDFYDLAREMNSLILRKYLDEETFSQNLITKQNKIDSALKNYITKKLTEKKIEINKEDNKFSRAKKIIKLYNVRTLINLEPNPISLNKELFILSRDIFKKSRKLVSKWGGVLYFVYLPSFEMTTKNNEEKNKNDMLLLANNLNIPTIDIYQETIINHADPLSLFPLRMKNHYNANGYRLISKTIINRLKKDGFNPSE